MVSEVHFRTDIPPNREILFRVPEDVPLGPADIQVLVTPQEREGTRSLGDLAGSEFFGMWKDRHDIQDVVAYARRLRKESWKR